MDKNTKMGGYCPSCLKGNNNCSCLNEYLEEYLDEMFSGTSRQFLSEAKTKEDALKRLSRIKKLKNG